MSSFRYLGALVLFAFASSTLFGASIVLNQGVFISSLAPGYYLENYEGFTPGNQNVNSISFSQGGFAYTANISGIQASTFWINSLGGPRVLSTENSDDDITFNFTSGNVRAVGGAFFPTNFPEATIPGNINLTLSDGTVHTVVNGTGSSFVGFITGEGVFITSLVVAAPNTDGVFRWPSVDNLYVGTVPEPATITLLGVGLLGLGAMARRLRRT